MSANWQAYEVILRLHAPLHIGQGRVSYLQRTRPYVTGRALRGALVSRMGRNRNDSGEEPGDPYRKVSKTLAPYMAFTYFYPALQKKNEAGKWEACFPWEDEPAFRRRFLGSYVSTALEYPNQAAAEGLLYETEFLSPYTLDSGEPVYLMGYIFVNEERLKLEKYDWQSALRRLQLGGERGYGWGDVRLVEAGLRKIPNPDNEKLFDRFAFHLENTRPSVHLKQGQPVLAHAEVRAPLSGNIEPMVGREWHADHKDQNRRHIGQHLAFNDLLFAPGSIATSDCKFWIGKGGYWQIPKESAP